MKIQALVTAVVLSVGMLGPAYAGCDVKNDEDKQGMCARKCDDEFISGKMHYGADISKVTAEKKACDEKCGCPQNSK